MRQSRQESVRPSKTQRAAAHVRSNLIAYLALFVALGGTSYAAAPAVQQRGHQAAEEEGGDRRQARPEGPEAVQGLKGPPERKVTGDLRAARATRATPDRRWARPPAHRQEPPAPSARATCPCSSADITTTGQSRITATARRDVPPERRHRSRHELREHHPAGRQPGHRDGPALRSALHRLLQRGVPIATAPGTATALSVEPAGTYTVNFACKNTDRPAQGRLVT